MLFRDYIKTFATNLKLGSDVNHTLLRPDGIQIAKEGALCFEDENLDVIQLIGAGSNPDIIQIPGTTLAIGAFSPSLTEEIGSCKELNHSWADGSYIDWHFHPCPTTALTGVAVFKLELDLIGLRVAVPTANYQTLRAEVSFDADSAYERYNVSFPQITPDGPFKQMPFRFYRDTSDPADTYSADVGMYTIGYHIQNDMLGSKSVETKY